ncbi:MAG: Pr6Pr family membrane protein, partial [Nakamurella sp.]
WRVLRMNAIIGITVTGLVAWFILRPLQNLQGAALLADQLLHIVSPAIAVIGWIVFGPRGRITTRVLWLSLIYPIGWLAYTLVRGAIVDWYPYPFIDVIQHRYPTVIVNCAVLAVGFIVLSFLALAADRGLSRLGKAPAQDRAPH